MTRGREIGREREGERECVIEMTICCTLKTHWSEKLGLCASSHACHDTAVLNSPPPYLGSCCCIFFLAGHVRLYKNEHFLSCSLCCHNISAGGVGYFSWGCGIFQLGVLGSVTQKLDHILKTCPGGRVAVNCTVSYCVWVYYQYWEFTGFLLDWRSQVKAL